MGRRKYACLFHVLLGPSNALKVTDDPDRAIYKREAINLLRLHRTSHAR